MRERRRDRRLGAWDVSREARERMEETKKKSRGVTGSQKSGTRGGVGRTEATREYARVSARFRVHLLRERVDHRRRDQELPVAIGVVLLRRASSRVAPERGDVLIIVEEAGGQHFLGLVELAAHHGADVRGSRRAASLGAWQGESDAEGLQARVHRRGRGRHSGARGDHPERARAEREPAPPASAGRRAHALVA